MTRLRHRYQVRYREDGVWKAVRNEDGTLRKFTKAEAEEIRALLPAEPGDVNVVQCLAGS